MKISPSKMKTLPLEFQKRQDGLPSHRFKQVFRSDAHAIYERTRLDGALVGFEAFQVRVRGAERSQRGVWYEEREVYPNANDFGKTAWFCMTLDRAKERLDL